MSRRKVDQLGAIPLAFAALLTAPVLAGAQAATPITFYKDIAPVIYRHCSSCHRPGESAPFSLLSYEDVRKHARQIAEVTKRRYMPPWLPEPGYGDFDGEMRLTVREIGAIEQWVQQQMPAGSSAEGPPTPKMTPGWQLGPPDLVIETSKPFLLKAGGSDQFWNFVLPLPVKDTRWVKAIGIRPGNPRVIHHANLILDRSGSARRLEESPGSGFAGMDLSIAEDAFDPDSHFLFWKPGSLPWVEPPGLAWRATPGMDIVLNLHLRPSGKPEEIRPSIGIYFSDQPQTKFPMLVQLEHDGALDIPAGNRDFVVSDDLRLPMDVLVLAIYPHAHYLGRLLEGYATLPDGTRKWLIRIPNWNFDWQSVYRYKQPILLPRGTVLSMRFHYDNSAANPRNPNSPPKRVVSGNNSTDEMSHLWVQVLPLGQNGRARLQEAIMQHRLEKYPGDFSAQLNLGALRMMRGDPGSAVHYFEGALMTRQGNAAARNALGAAFLSQSKPSEAAEQFRLALATDPRYTDARYNLAQALASQEEWALAAGEFRKVLAERPDDKGVRDHLLEVLLRFGHESIAAGNLEQTVACFREASALKPGDASLHANLGTALARLGRFAEAIPQFETALSIDPNLEAVKRNLSAARSMLKAHQ